MCVIVICISILFSFEPYLRPLEIKENKSKYTRIEVMLSSSETVHCCYISSSYLYKAIFMSNLDGKNSDSKSDHGQSSETFINTRPVRAKVPTAKGEEYICSRPRVKQTSGLAAITRKRTEITRLMANDENLHLAKSALDDINDLFIKYQDIHHEYLSTLPLEEDKEREVTRYEVREKSFLDFRNQVREWITLAEHRLSDHLDESSEVKGSRLIKSLKSPSLHPSTSSTAVSSRTKERVKVAELLAEKAMLKRKQALDVAAENLRLETEIAKAEAREKVYGDLIAYEEKPLIVRKKARKC